MLKASRWPPLLFVHLLVSLSATRQHHQAPKNRVSFSRSRLLGLVEEKLLPQRPYLGGTFETRTGLRPVLQGEEADSCAGCDPPGGNADDVFAGPLAGSMVRMAKPRSIP